MLTLALYMVNYQNFFKILSQNKVMLGLMVTMLVLLTRN